MRDREQGSTRSREFFFMTYIYLHLSVETIVEEEVVGHSDAVRLHRVTLPIVVVTNVT